MSGDENGTVRLWNRKARPIGKPTKGHVGRVASVAISSDRKYLMVGDKAGNIMLRQFSIDLFLREACEWMRYHRALTAPKTPKEKRAAKIAQSLFGS